VWHPFFIQAPLFFKRTSSFRKSNPRACYGCTERRIRQRCCRKCFMDRGSRHERSGRLTVVGISPESHIPRVHHKITHAYRMKCEPLNYNDASGLLFASYFLFYAPLALIAWRTNAGMTEWYSERWSTSVIRIALLAGQWAVRPLLTITTNSDTNHNRKKTNWS